ncbi:MAG: BTAD domain-containing putative transcriptional regulator [Acidimicrobiales bacterium]
MEVALDDGVIDVGGPRTRALLAMLLVDANRVVSADRLIDGLWPEQAPRRAAAGLQVMVSNLRRALEPDRPARTPAQVLVTKPPGYVLVVEEPDLDSARFESLLRTGQRQLAEGQAGPARETLEEALALWRGPALAEFAFEDFARAQAARLQELRTVALEERVRADLELGRHSDAVADVERLLGEHPLREQLWALLMIGYYRSGRQADALRAFQQARQHLAEELGIDPGPALQQLESDVLAQAASLDWHPPPATTTSEPTKASEQVAAPSTLVGRASELGRLERALQEAAAGHGRLVLVSGEPGVGKTRLVEELSASAERAGAVVAWGRCHPGDSAPPFWPWTQVLRTAAAVETHAGPETAALTQLLPELRETPDPGRAVADPAHARFQLCQDLTAYLREVARSRCLVVVLDDLHWADPPSMELLTILGSRLEGAGLLLVGTYRDVEIDVDHPLVAAMASLARQTVVERIELSGISPEEAGLLIANAIGSEPSADLTRAMHARTDGNPFYMVELLRLLESEGPVSERDHEAALRSAVPVGVRDVISQRFAQLTPTARTVLTVAAVAGREFDQQLLDAASDVGEEDALASVELALSRGILAESPDVVGRYRFSHALIRETIYGDISRLRRARLHARVGEALERLAAGDGGAEVAELAHHFWNAVPVAGAGKAFRYAMAAADAASGQLAYERAHEHLQRALGLVPSLPVPERATAELAALARLGTLLAASRGQAAPEVESAFARASELCRQGEATRDATTALWGFFYSSYVRGQLDDARSIAAQLLALAAESASAEVALAGQLAMGIVSFHEGRLAAAQEHLAASTDLADHAADLSLAAVFQVDPRVYSRCFQALALGLVGEPGPAADIARQARELAAEGPQPFSMATAAMFSAWLGFLLEDPDSVRDHAAEAIAVSDDHGFPLLAAAASAFDGWVLARGDQAEAGAARVAAGLAAYRPGGTTAQPLFAALEAEVEHLAGRHDRALALLDQALPQQGAGQSSHYFDAALHRLRAEILLDAYPERAAEAAEGLRQSAAIAVSQGAATLERRATTTLSSM